MHTHTFISALCLGVACSIIGVTIIVIMPKEKILNWWFLLGERIGKEFVNGEEKERLIYRPIWGCEKCFSGQLALWIYFFSHIKGNSPVDWQANGWFSFPDYSLLGHVLSICIAIFTAVIFSHIINKIQKSND